MVDGGCGCVIIVIVVLVRGDAGCAVGGKAERGEFEVVASVEFVMAFVCGAFGNSRVFFCREGGGFLKGGVTSGLFFVAGEGDVGAGFEELFPELGGMLIDLQGGVVGSRQVIIPLRRPRRHGNSPRIVRRGGEC